MEDRRADGGARLPDRRQARQRSADQRHAGRRDPAVDRRRPHARHRLRLHDDRPQAHGGGPAGEPGRRPIARRALDQSMKILGLGGWSGAGKTTLLSKLIPELIRRGVTVSTMKHAHHGFDVDQPGKDSYVHRQAGATEVLVASEKRWALMHENRQANEPTAADLARHMSPVDLLLVEGFKREPHDKLEIYRAENGKPVLPADDSTYPDLLSDTAVSGTRLPVIDLNDIPAIADFIVRHCGLKTR